MNFPLMSYPTNAPLLLVAHCLINYAKIRGFKSKPSYINGTDKAEFLAQYQSVKVLKKYLLNILFIISWVSAPSMPIC